MKYTYQISFNGSDYFDLTPGNDVEMDGNWIDGTKIWRENISDLKITKRDNSTIYDTLETYFEDSAYFTTRIFVKVLKSTVQESLHWFGIKWGTLNKELKTYEVQPLAYDLWGQYFEAVYDQNEIINLSDYGECTYTFFDHRYLKEYDYLGESINASDYSVSSIFTRAKKLVAKYTDWDPANIVSSLINDDNYENGNAIATEYGVDKDYVTDDQTNIQNAGGYWDVKQSLSEFVSDLKIINIYPFFDSNNKLRFEHLKFFINKLIDNAVDYSSNLEDYNNKFNYDIVEIPIIDRIEMSVADDNTDPDFVGFPIVYSPPRCRPDSQFRDFRSQYTSDLLYYTLNSLSDRSVLFSSPSQYIYKFVFTSITGTLTTNDKNRIGFTSSGAGQSWAYSNTFKIANGDGVFFRAVIESVTGTISCELINHVTTITQSNTINITSTGTTTGTLTATQSMDAAQLKIIAPASAGFVGYFIIDYNTSKKYIVPIVDGFVSGESKSNGHFSTSNIINNYWKDNGLARYASYNGVVMNFDNTEYNLRRDTIKFYHDGVINPLYGFNDGSRIGLIEKWNRNLATGFYKIDLIYQEDE